MTEAKISARVDKDTKEMASKIFEKLGLNLSSAISLYLRQVVIANGIPFPLTLERSAIIGKDVVEFEEKMAEIIKDKITVAKAEGKPVARYDAKLKKAYLEYPDERGRVYDFAENP